MHHLVGKRNKLVEGGYDTFSLRGIVLDHLNGAKEEWVSSGHSQVKVAIQIERQDLPSPQHSGFGCVDFGSKPAALVLMIKYVVKELLCLSEQLLVPHEDRIGDHTVL